MNHPRVLTGCQYDMIQTWQPGKPIFIIGHSMGGLLTAVYLLDHQQDFAGAVLSGPCVKIPDHISSGTITIAKIFSRLVPKLGLIKIEADGISRDPAVAREYINDPLICTGKAHRSISFGILSSDMSNHAGDLLGRFAARRDAC
jgi:alpha-beta hydrolase superfamily lysophospholipase